MKSIPVFLSLLCRILTPLESYYGCISADFRELDVKLLPVDIPHFKGQTPYNSTYPLFLEDAAGTQIGNANCHNYTQRLCREQQSKVKIQVKKVKTGG